MRILTFLSGLRTIPLPPAGVLLALDPSDRGPPRVVAPELELMTAVRSPSAVAALLEALANDGPWVPGPLFRPEHLAAVDPEGELLGAADRAALPWVLLPPLELRKLANAVTGTLVGVDLMERTPSRRHQVNLLVMRYRRALGDDPVLGRVARNVFDVLGHRLG